MIIETDRLLLREMTDDDFQALYKVLADSNIMKHYPHAFDENIVSSELDILVNALNKTIVNLNLYINDIIRFPGFKIYYACLLK